MGRQQQAAQQPAQSKVADSARPTDDQRAVSLLLQPADELAQPRVLRNTARGCAISGRCCWMLPPPAVLLSLAVSHAARTAEEAERSAAQRGKQGHGPAWPGSRDALDELVVGLGASFAAAAAAAARPQPRHQHGVGDKEHALKGEVAPGARQVLPALQGAGPALGCWNHGRKQAEPGRLCTPTALPNSPHASSLRRPPPATTEGMAMSPQHVAEPDAEPACLPNML